MAIALLMPVLATARPAAAIDLTDDQVCDLTPRDGTWAAGASTVDFDLSVRGIQNWDVSVPTAQAACSNLVDVYDGQAWIGPLAVGAYSMASNSAATAEVRRIGQEAAGIALFAGTLDGTDAAGAFAVPFTRVLFEYDEVWIGAVGSFVVFGHAERDGQDGDQVNAATAAMIERIGVIVGNIGTVGSGTTNTTTTTTSIVTPTGQPLCAEAIHMFEGFGADRLAAGGVTDTTNTDVAINGDFLKADFQLAIVDYNAANPSNQAYSTESIGGITDVLWLFSNGHVVPALNSQYLTGHERALRDRIEALSNQRRTSGGNDHRLTPGEVFELALDLNGGNANQAMLTAHNTMRTLARGDGTGGLANFPVANADPDFFDDHLVPVRSAGDNTGGWYHLFGTGYMEMASRGDWSPYAASGGAALFASAGGPPAWLAAAIVIAISAGLKVDSDATETAGASRLFNALEQLVRENGRGRGSAPDPVEFCYNVWGAQVGRDLYLNLPNRFTRGLFEPSYPGFVPPDPELPGFDAVRGPASARFLDILHSPFAVQLDDGTHRLVFDQVGPGIDQQQLVGYVDGLALPFPESDSWGFVYAPPGDGTIEATFEAIVPGATMHLTRTDLVTGESFLWVDTAAAAGDRYTTTVGSGGQPVLTGPDGVVIVPETFTVDLAGSSDGTATGSVPVGGSDDDDGNVAALVAVIGGTTLLVIALILGLIALFRRPPPALPPPPAQGGREPPLPPPPAA